MRDFKEELQELINYHCKENGGNTPDFILAEYLNDCLETYNKAVKRNVEWHGSEESFGFRRG